MNVRFFLKRFFNLVDKLEKLYSVITFFGVIFFLVKTNNNSPSISIYCHIILMNIIFIEQKPNTNKKTSLLFATLLIICICFSSSFQYIFAKSPYKPKNQIFVNIRDHQKNKFSNESYLSYTQYP